MTAKALTGTELTEALAGLPGWTVTDGALTASFTADRAALPGFYAAVAAAEDTAGHHARITILYGTVTFALNTHDAGGSVTVRDTGLAATITALAAAHQVKPAG